MKKSKLKLVENGYAYIKGKTNGNKVFGKRDKSAQLHTENDDIVHRLEIVIMLATLQLCKQPWLSTARKNWGLRRHKTLVIKSSQTHPWESAQLLLQNVHRKVRGRDPWVEFNVTQTWLCRVSAVIGVDYLEDTWIGRPQGHNRRRELDEQTLSVKLLYDSVN